MPQIAAYDAGGTIDARSYKKKDGINNSPYYKN